MVSLATDTRLNLSNLTFSSSKIKAFPGSKFFPYYRRPRSQTWRVNIFTTWWFIGKSVMFSICLYVLFVISAKSMQVSFRYNCSGDIEIIITFFLFLHKTSFKCYCNRDTGKMFQCWMLLVVSGIFVNGPSLTAKGWPDFFLFCMLNPYIISICSLISYRI